MRNTDTRFRTWWAFAGFAAIAGFFLFTEHRAHLFGMLPFLFLLACPLLHMFGHGGHGGHGEHSGRAVEQERSTGGHQHNSGATPDDWRS